MIIGQTQFQVGTTGEPITNLHRRLALHGIAVPADEVQDDRFGAGTEAAICLFQAANGLPSHGIVDDVTARALGLGGAPKSIAGLVCKPDGTSLANIAVHVYRQGPSGEKIVAEAHSRADGKFSVPWPQGILGGLSVRADGSAAKPVPWKTVPSAGSAWVRLSVGGEYRGATKLAMLTAAVEPAADGDALHTAGGAGQTQQLKALSEAARAPEQDVSRLVLAHKLAAKTGVDAGVMFAVLTKLVTPDMLSLSLPGPSAGDADALDDEYVERVLHVMMRQRRSDVHAALDKAVADNVVGGIDVDAAADQIHALRLDHIAGQPLVWSLGLATTNHQACCALAIHPATTSEGEADDAAHATQPLRVDHAPLRDVLATAVTDPAVQRKLFEALAAYDGHSTLASVIDGAADLTAAEHAQLQFTVETAVLLANHLPLIKHVQKLRAAGVISKTSDLAQFDEADWANLLRDTDPDGERIGLPATGKAEASLAPAAPERITRFAKLLTRRLEISHPTVALSGRLAKDRGELRLAATKDVKQFLDRVPAFCVRHSHIDGFVHDHGTQALPAGDDHAQVVSDLKKLQRVYKLTPRFDHVKAMLAAGHNSAHSVYAAGPEQFAAQMTSEGVTASDAKAIFGQAQQVHATALTLMTNFHSAFTAATPAAVAQPVLSAAATTTLASFPTIQSLFGPISYCVCEDCRAAHGPAAYLVDILQFLAGRAATTGNARDVLISATGRRPDIGQIQLSCANTNGVAPYIDLVCEILEDAVSAPAAGAVGLRQTSGTEDELRANPAFVSDAAYSLLRTATFPIAAPFDLYAAEVRAFFRQVGVKWHELLAAWQVVSGSTLNPTDTVIGGERLGFNANALTVVTTGAPAQPWTLWNLGSTNTGTDTAVTFVAASTPTTSRAATIVLTIPAGVLAGDTMLYFTWTGKSADTNLNVSSLPTGWAVMARNDASSGQSSILLRHIATASEPASYTFPVTATGSGNPLVGVGQVYRGLDPNAAIVATSLTEVTTAGTSFVCPSASLTTYSDLYIGLVADHSTTATTTAPAGATKRVDTALTTNGGAHIALFDLSANAVGPTGTRTATLSASSTGVAVSYALAKQRPAVPDPRTPDSAAAAISGTWLQVLQFVPILLDRLKVQHRELVQLLQTRFINPNNALTIVETANANGFATCDAGLQTVQCAATPAIQADLMTRLNRFVRLWRQVGCTIWDLDKTLCLPTIGNVVLDANAIALFGHVDAVAARLGGPRDELLTLWGNIDTFDYLDVLADPEAIAPSVYRRRFRNATVTLASPVFVDNPASLTGTLNNVDVIAGISAALDISSDDLQRVLAAAGVATTAALNLTNLSTIARYAILASRLQISISDLITAIAVTGVNPFPTTLSPTTTQQFLTAFDQIQTSGFSLLELNYLLRHNSVIESGIGLSDNTMTAWLEDLRRALVRLGPPRPTTNPTDAAAAAAELAAAAANLVVQKISAALPLDPTLTQQVLNATLPHPDDTGTIASLFTASNLTMLSSGSFVTATTRANFGPIFDAYTALDKMRILLSRWRVSTADALWLLQHATTGGWIALHTLPANATIAASSTVTFTLLMTLHNAIVLQQTLASPTNVRLFDLVLSPGSTAAIAQANLAQLGNWTTSDITAVAGRLALSTATLALFTGANPAQIRDLMAWPRKLGADVPTTLSFLTNVVDSTSSRKARQLAKSKYTNDQWLGVAGQVQDGLRAQKSAALVAWLLAQPNPTRSQKWVTADDLYGYFLIDPQMAPSATTTRIKQATASAQLFVQRCLLQLEPSVSANADSDSVWNQWTWMKRFVLWQANRKIFLYPENWYDPSQRKDMSPYFADLVNELQQTDLTNDVAEDALREYLQKLSDVSHLEVSGIWEEVISGSTILHVVARTRKTPYVYSYRRRDTTGAWSPWEPLDAGVDTNPVMPAIWNKRLFMLWAEFTEKSLPTQSTDRTVPTTTMINATPSAAVANETTKYWEIALAWIERRNDIWLAKRLSQRKQVLPGGPTAPREQFVLKVATPGRNLTVDLYQPVKNTRSPTPLTAEWLLTSPQDEPVLMNNTPKGTPGSAGVGGLPDIFYTIPVTGGDVRMGTVPQLATANMTWNLNAYGGNNAGTTGALALPRVDSQGNGSTPTLVSTIGQARVISSRFGDNDQFGAPFFVSDPQRTFFVLDGNWNLQAFYHPFTDTFIQQLNMGGVPGLYNRTLQTSPDTLRGTSVFDFNATYGAGTAIAQPYPTETIDYSQSGPYSIYNWELFFHAPLLIAKRLADNQRFDEALNWFHYIFNPTTVSGGDPPQRYWNPMVFRNLVFPTDYTNQQIEQVLQLVHQGDTGTVPRVADWRNDPFDPNLVASVRPVAYQKAVVMQYISTLIAWGDQLFRGNTIESVNEASQLYLLANQLLGPRPQSLRAIQPDASQNKAYNDIMTTLDAFSDAVTLIENLVSVPPPGITTTPPLPTLNTFYFCIPPNDQMLSYWDTVADRLFKVRNGLDINGVARPLPLFDAPIDPGLLVRASVAGLDASAALADAAVTLMCYRFNTLLQVAHDLCQDVRGLGGAILSALERRDAEQMARLRATQEVAVQDAMRMVKSKQLDDANASKAALQSSRDLASMRSDYYSSRVFMNASETQGQQLIHDAIELENAGIIFDIVAASASLIPALVAGANGFGGTPHLTLGFGGEQLSRAAAASAGVLRGYASVRSQRAGRSNTHGSYERRADDWDLQHRLADKEIDQIDNQLTAADARIQVAQREIDIQAQQFQDAQDNAALLQTKFTNQELYDWMLSQLSATYFQAYQLAYDLAKRASAAYAFELAVPDPGFIQFGYWDSLHKGLVAGDKLLLDLRRLQTSYLNLNKRELELTRHVSLLQLDPSALITLRQTGTCFINLPESLFDLDQPGHYLRRLKTVSVTLPCVTGPYTSINATLTLASSTTRISTDTTNGYPPTDTPDPTDGLPTTDARFQRSVGAIQSVALSSGREDAGLFEVNFHDERYLPFEGLGAISHWRLDLPRDANQFDLETLSDVILHVRYTARDGGADFRTAAKSAVTDVLPRNGFQLLSARTEFPDAYARLFAPTGSGQSLDMALTTQHFPFTPTTQQINLTGMSAILLFTADRTYSNYLALATTARLNAHLGLSTSDGTPPTTTATFTATVPTGTGAVLGGVPVAPVTLSGPIGSVSVAFVETDLAAATLLDQTVTEADGTAHNRLNQAMIDDILILVTYELGMHTRV